MANIYKVLTDLYHPTLKPVNLKSYSIPYLTLPEFTPYCARLLRKEVRNGLLKERRKNAGIFFLSFICGKCLIAGQLKMHAFSCQAQDTLDLSGPGANLYSF